VTEEANVTLTAVGIPSQVITVPVTLSVGNTFVVGNTNPVVDQCPNDPDKTQPGLCGCGVSDSTSGQTCTTGLSGVCSAGTTVCAGGSASCVQNQQPLAELCDGLDNNCNGVVDDNVSGVGQTCTVPGQLGLCSLSATACAAGVLSCAQTTQPSAEVCDGQDNDCDGTVDNGNPSGGAACITTQPGVCSAGTETCTNGALSCQPNGQPTTELCDELDNDCDGQTDEGVTATFYQDADGDGFGSSASTTQACNAPAGYVSNSTDCNDATVAVHPGAAEICGNSIDEDCDGADLVCPPVDACIPTTVLDNFDRADGNVGNNWRGVTGTSFYRIAGNRLDVQAGGPLYWNPAAFGTSQAAFVTLSSVDTKSPSQGVLLKVQSGTVPNAGAISVVYDAVAKAVRVSTLRLGTLSWTPYGNTAVPFANGDKLGACAKANGEVRVYKNDALVKTVTLNTADQGFFNPKGGKVGVWSVLAPQAFMDNFGGATIGP